MKEYRAAAAILSAALIAGFAAIPVSAGSMGASGPVSPIQLYTGFTYQMEWSEEANRYLAESICPMLIKRSSNGITTDPQSVVTRES